MRQDYFYQSSTGYTLGWYGSGQYHFYTFEEACDFAKFWNVHIPKDLHTLILCNSNA